MARCARTSRSLPCLVTRSRPSAQSFVNIPAATGEDSAVQTPKPKSSASKGGRTASRTADEAFSEPEEGSPVVKRKSEQRVKKHHTCRVCKSSFDRESWLKTHMACNRCDRQGRSAAVAARHKNLLVLCPNTRGRLAPSLFNVRYATLLSGFVDRLEDCEVVRTRMVKMTRRWIVTVRMRATAALQHGC